MNYDKAEFVAELYLTLASYQEKLGDKEEQISSLNKVKKDSFKKIKLKKMN